jgi:hypothetical protein
VGITFNPFTGELDFTGAGSVPVTVAPRYNKTITNPDWVVDGSDYSITILYSVHQKDTTPSVVCFEEISPGVFEEVKPNITINTIGDIKIKVNQTPDLRFSGKLIII